MSQALEEYVRVDDGPDHEVNCTPLVSNGSTSPLELRPDPLAVVAGAVETEEGVGGAVREEDAGGVVAEGGGELEAVAGAAAEEPDVPGLGVAVEEEVAVRAVLVLADAGLDERRAGERGEAAGQGLARRGQERAG